MCDEPPVRERDIHHLSFEEVPLTDADSGQRQLSDRVADVLMFDVAPRARSLVDEARG